MTDLLDVVNLLKICYIGMGFCSSVTLRHLCWNGCIYHQTFLPPSRISG